MTPDPASQHMVALARANVIRLGRAAAKRDIADGTLGITAALHDERLQSMVVMDLLLAQRRWGRTRARKTLDSLGLEELKPVGSLTVRQQDALLVALGLKQRSAPRRAPAPPPARPPSTSRREPQGPDVAVVCLALLGRGGRTVTEIQVLIREAATHAVPDRLGALLEDMAHHQIVWRDDTSGFTLYGVDSRYTDDGPNL